MSDLVTGGRDFLELPSGDAASSARVIVPLIMELLPGTRSVVDVGCGNGLWLAEFKEAGVTEILGFGDGSEPENFRLEIDSNEFVAMDLQQPSFPIARRFDLCLCLEAATRLTPQASQSLIHNLCSLSDIVLFCSGVPEREVINNANERWPSYWAEIFAANGFNAADIVRERIWYDRRVSWRYRQSTLLFASSLGLRRLGTSPGLQGFPLDVVHPECFGIYHDAYARMCRAVEESRAIENLQLLKNNRELEASLNQVFGSRTWRIASAFRNVYTSAMGVRRGVRNLLHLHNRD